MLRILRVKVNIIGYLNGLKAILIIDRVHKVRYDLVRFTVIASTEKLLSLLA